MFGDKGILTHEQRAILKVLGQLPDIQYFYLTGGTALSEFYLGHRLSFDLYLFTFQENLVRSFSLNIERRIREVGWDVRVIRRFSTLVEMVVLVEGKEVRLDFALDTPVRLAPTNISKYGVDLQAEKTLAYYGRAEMRDAVDLYFLLKIAPMKILLQRAASKDSGFDIYWFAVALQRAEMFPDEFTRWPVKMLRSFEPKELKARFLSLAQELMDSLTGG